MRLLKHTPLIAAAALIVATPILTLGPLSRAQARPLRPGTADISELKVGQKGYGLTVFKGTKPEKFDVEIVGFLKNFLPRQDLILIRTPHERLNIAHTVAGMSGSPIYINGKMIGAYAYGWRFGSEPIAGVTPIRNMLEDLARPIPPSLLKPIGAGGPARTKRIKGLAKLSSARIPDIMKFEGDLLSDLRNASNTLNAKLALPRGGKLTRVNTPVSLGGLAPRAARLAQDLLDPLGFEASQGGGTGSKKGGGPAHFEDGGAVGVQLIRGDISAMGLGTVTRVEGKRLVGFGHPMWQAGISQLPTSTARVAWIMASSMHSFKLGEPIKPLGALINDLQSSIVVDETVHGPTIPLSVKVDGVKGAPKTKWDMEVAHNRFVSGALIGVAMGNAVESTVSERRDAVWNAYTTVKVAGYGTYKVHDFGLAIGGTPNSMEFRRSVASRSISQILNNPWEPAAIEKVDMKMEIRFKRELYSIRGSRLLDPVVDPGSKARIELTLREFNGPDTKRIVEIPIPKEAAGRRLRIRLTPGWRTRRQLPPPENLAQFISNVPRLTYRPDALILSYSGLKLGVMKGNKVAKNLPPSAYDLLQSETSSIGPRGFSPEKRIVVPFGKFIEGSVFASIQVRSAAE